MKKLLIWLPIVYYAACLLLQFFGAAEFDQMLEWAGGLMANFWLAMAAHQGLKLQL